MEKGTHGHREASFEDLNYDGQAKSINGQIRTIEKSIIAHLRRANDESRNVTVKRNSLIDQVNRMISRIR